MKGIIVDYVYPPTPTRIFGYCAYFDGEEEGLVGYGPTKEAAIKDLKEQEDD